MISARLFFRTYDYPVLCPDCFVLAIHSEGPPHFHRLHYHHCPNARKYFLLVPAAVVAVVIDDYNCVSDQSDFDNLDSDSDVSVTCCWDGSERHAHDLRFGTHPLSPDYFCLDSLSLQLIHRSHISDKRNADLDNCGLRRDFVFAHRWARLPARSPIFQHLDLCFVLSHAQRIVDLTLSLWKPLVYR